MESEELKELEEPTNWNGRLLPVISEEENPWEHHYSHVSCLECEGLSTFKVQTVHTLHLGANAMRQVQTSKLSNASNACCHVISMMYV